MSYREIVLDRFEFPPELPDARANFRVVFDVRYVVGDGAKAKPKQATSIAPGADTFWECDRSRKHKANFVRARLSPRRWDSTINMELLDPWSRTVLLVQADEILAVRAKVFDIDREGFWDRIGNLAGGLLSGLAGLANKSAKTVVPGELSRATGDAFDELSSFVAKKLAGGGDKVLFQGSARPQGDRLVITGPGTNGRKGRGIYTLELAIR